MMRARDGLQGEMIARFLGDELEHLGEFLVVTGSLVEVDIGDMGDTDFLITTVYAVALGKIIKEITQNRAAGGEERETRAD